MTRQPRRNANECAAKYIEMRAAGSIKAMRRRLDTSTEMDALTDTCAVTRNRDTFPSNSCVEFAALA